MKKKFIIALTAVLVLGVSAIVLYPKLFPSKGERKVSYWTDPMMPGYKSPAPGKSPMGMEMVPVYADEAHSKAGEQSAQEGKEEYYCPMHPDMKSDKPGNCPVCSMKLVKLEKGNSGKSSTSGAATGLAAGAGTTGGSIFIDPQRQQLIGVKTAVAQMKPLMKEIRAVGKVAYDETKLYNVNTKIMGWVEKLYVDYTGKAVRKGDPLLEIYSPDLVNTEQEYLLALRYRDQLQASSVEEARKGAEELVATVKRRLLYWDISPDEIQEIEKLGVPKKVMTIYSPANGIVMEKMVVNGQNIMAGMTLYKIADLSDVWVLVDIYQFELAWVKLNQDAEVELSYLAGKVLRGKITYIYPFLSKETRTVKVRIEVPNPKGEIVLKPDMFSNVKLKANMGTKLVVPEDAVMNTGTEQYVFVDKGDGYIEPRFVKIGAEADGQYAIESGLKEGERVVTTANFILDSESRLKGAFANMGRPDEKKMEKPASAASSLKVEIQVPKVAKVGTNDLRLTVRDASGNPVTDAEVEVTLFMPQMGNMAPMTAKANLSHAGNGEYKGSIDIPIAWTWQTTITVKKAGKTLGSVQTNLTAR